MKIEKLTENKIRAIVNLDDLEKNHTDLHTIMTKALETQGLVLEILSKAEKEVGFNTDGCKLLIEAFSSSDGNFIFTITKYKQNDNKTNISSPTTLKNRLIAKRKELNIKNKTSIFRFDNFDNFCDFSICASKSFNCDFSKLSKISSLYLYNDTYYLILDKININYPYLKRFYSLVSEFGNFANSSKAFTSKLLEHGTVIIKKDAITAGIKFFS